MLEFFSCEIFSILARQGKWDTSLCLCAWLKTLLACSSVFCTLDLNIKLHRLSCELGMA
jgi:hypothetical protein